MREARALVGLLLATALVIIAELGLACSNISNTKDPVQPQPSTEKRFEKMMCSRVFLTNLEVFANVVRHCPECLIYLLNQ